MIALASCQDVADETGPGEAVTFEPGYPSLHTVPPRPQLSYSIEQRRAIVDQLIADRANARYTDEVVRYRAGLSSQPPPAAPTLAAAQPELGLEAPDAAQTVTPPGAAPTAPPETKFRSAEDSLDSFMQDMYDDHTTSPGPVNRDPGGAPEANAAALGTRVIRASAVAPGAPVVTYHGRASVVTLAMPPETVSLPIPHPAPPLASPGSGPQRLPPPPLGEPLLAGRAPAVVWGMPDSAPDSALPVVAGRAGSPRATRQIALAPAPAEPALTARAPGVVWGMPELAPEPTLTLTQVANAEIAPSDAMVVAGEVAAPVPPPEHSAPAPDEPLLAGRAPGVVWGMPELAPEPAPADPPAARSHLQVAQAVVAPRAAPQPAPAKPAVPAETILAGQEAAPAPTAPPPRREAPPAPAPRPAPAETMLADLTPGPVRAMPAAMAEARSGQTVEADTRGAPAVTLAQAPPPAPAKPAVAGDTTDRERIDVALRDQPEGQPLAHAAGSSAIEVARGLISIDGASGPRRAAAFGSIPFRPESAILTPDAVVLLAQFLAETEMPAARIKIVGEAPAPGLALDRALAVGLALVQGGVSADRLELTLAHGGSGDQARLFLAAPEL